MKPEIQAKFYKYPADAKKQLEALRRLIFEILKENNLGAVEETLQWGEASYLVKGGTTTRMDWKPQSQPLNLKIL